MIHYLIVTMELRSSYKISSLFFLIFLPTVIFIVPHVILNYEFYYELYGHSHTIGPNLHNSSVIHASSLNRIVDLIPILIHKWIILVIEIFVYLEENTLLKLVEKILTSI